MSLEKQPRASAPERLTNSPEMAWNDAIVQTVEKEAMVRRNNEGVSGVRKDVYLDSEALERGLANGQLIDAIKSHPKIAASGFGFSMGEKIKQVDPAYPYIPLWDHARFSIISNDREELARRVTDYFKKQAHAALLRTNEFTDRPISDSRVVDPEELYSLLLEDKKRERDGRWDMVIRFSPPGLEPFESSVVVESEVYRERDIPLLRREDGQYQFSAQATPITLLRGSADENLLQAQREIQLDVLSALRILNEFKHEGFTIGLELTSMGPEEEGNADIYYHAR